MDDSLLCAYVLSLQWLECLLKSALYALYDSEAFMGANLIDDLLRDTVM